MWRKQRSPKALKEENYVSSCKGLMCLWKTSPLGKQNHVGSKGANRAAAWSRDRNCLLRKSLFTLQTYQQLWLRSLLAALCAHHTGRDAHLGSYSHKQPPGFIQRALLKHISEAPPDDPDVPVERGGGVTRPGTVRNRWWSRWLQQEGSVGSFTSGLRLEESYQPHSPCFQHCPPPPSQTPREQNRRLDSPAPGFLHTFCSPLEAVP